MSDSALQTSATAWRAPLPHEWDTSDRAAEMAPAEITFGELISALNPLQHIPVVGSLYRELTGDTLHPAARVIGGAVIGGPIGLVASAFNAILEQASGHDVVGQVVSLFTPDKDTPAASIASAEPAAAEPSAPGVETAAVTPPPVMPVPVADLASLTPAAGPTKPAAKQEQVGEPQGRSLSFYQNHAGQRLPQFGNMTTQRTALTGTPNPTLQRQPLEVPKTAAAPSPIPSPPQAAAQAQDNAAAGTEAADVFFVNAMMQGLDRYRDAKRLQNGTGARQVDVSR